MHIELLWLVPIFAFAGFLFFIAFHAQRKSELQSREKNLSKEVELFNAGKSAGNGKPSQGNHDERLRELEKAINTLSTSLSTERIRQEKLKEDGGPGGQNEIDGLKEKLRTVFREYDIVLSENYALRAKVRQIMKMARLDDPKEGLAKAAADLSLMTAPSSGKPNLHLFGDTRLMKVVEQEPDEEETGIGEFRAKK